MLKAYFETLCAFIKSIFSDAGQGSSSRVLTGASVFSTLSWVSYVVLKTHAIPDLTGPAMFIAAASGSLYGVNQAKEIVASFKGK